VASVLMDTNVLVYTLDPRDQVRQDRAIQLVLRLEAEGEGSLSAQCLSEFANVLITKQRLSAGETMLQVDKWRSAFPVFPLTPQIVLEAVRGVRDHQLSYYDSQIWACARLNQIPVVFSEDFQDGQLLEGVNFVNPFADQFDFEMW